MAFQDHLQFYLKNKISPVRQDISDLQRHLDRRASLYQRLGVPRQFIKGRDVLEVGPGSGHNSLYVAACLPARLDLVEPNPVARAGIVELYRQFKLEHTAPGIVPASLETFDGNLEYDFAIAEAWLGGVEHELGLIRKLSARVKPGGVLILTLQSPVGMLANMLRRLLACELAFDLPDIRSQTQVLLAAFGAHLSTMKAMSRLHEDWIQDTLLNPAALTGVLTPAILLEILPDFGVYETYPKIMTDWRWYKELTGANRTLNRVLVECWRNQTHNFFNVHAPVVAAITEGDFNARLEAESQRLIDYLIECETRGIKPDRMSCRPGIQRIAGLLADARHPDAGSIVEFMAVYGKDRIDPAEVAAMPSFGKVFGRELVYISLIRDH